MIQIHEYWIEALSKNESDALFSDLTEKNEQYYDEKIIEHRSQIYYPWKESFGMTAVSTCCNAFFLREQLRLLLVMAWKLLHILHLVGTT